MRKFILLSLMLGVTGKAYSMSCKDLVSATAPSSIDQTAQTSSFDMALAILEQSFSNHSLASRSMKADELFPFPLNKTLDIKTYAVTLADGNQLVVQFEYLVRQTELNRHYYKVTVSDIDESLSLFHNKGDFYTSFDPSGIVQAQFKDEGVDPEVLPGIGLGFYSVQVIDEHNDSFAEDVPFSVEVVFGDFSNNQNDTLEFQRILSVLMSHISPLGFQQ